MSTLRLPMVLLAVIAVAPPGIAAAQSEADLVRAALARQDLARARAVVPAWDEAAARARAWAPEYSISARREESQGREPFTTDVAGFGVGIELSSRNRSAREAATARAATARAALDGRLLGAACEIRALALEAWLAGREAGVLAEGVARAESLRDDLAALVEGGEHARFDVAVVDADLELRRREAWRAGARAAAGRRMLEERAGVAVGELRLSPLAEPAPFEAEAVLESHPALAELGARATAARADSAHAAGDGAARLDVEAGWRRDDAPAQPAGDGYEVGVALTLPTRSLRAAGVAEARIAEAEAGADLEMARAELRARAASALAAWQALAAQEPPPVNDALLDDARVRYLAGEGSLGELMVVADGADEAALEGLRFEAERRRARLDLDCVTALATAPEFLALLKEIP